MRTPLRIFPHVEHDHWGRPAGSSLVAALAGATGGSEPCSELWLGAHPDARCEAECEAGRTRLAPLIAAHPGEILGADVRARFGDALPFLFKILSIAKPLSIQAHPDKKLAERLHRERGYPDANHKPEMAVALSDISLLFGFRPLTDAALDFQRLPELAAGLGGELSAKLQAFDGRADQRELLRAVYAAMLAVPADSLRKAAQQLRERLQKAGCATAHDGLALRLLTDEFPEGDVGVFSLYLMNLLSLEPGEAIFIPANTIHAYLSGELAECMANSDNVVRAGLTPKVKDTETLLSMLNYEAAYPALLPAGRSAHGAEYRVPQPNAEFAIDMLEGRGAYDLRHQGPRILLCVSGRGRLHAPQWQAPLERGSAFLVPAAVAEASVELEEGLCFVALVP